MKVIRAVFSFSMFLILLMAGAFKVDGQGQTLNPANQIVLNAQGQQSEQFNAPDLTVIYTYYANNVGDTINFSTSVVVPPQTAPMAFTCTGQAYAAGSGGPDPINFSFYPFTN